MGYRVLLSLVGLAVGVALLAGSLSAHTQAKGGTLRISSVHDVDSLDSAIAWRTDSWMVEYATCAKLYNYPDKPGPDGTQVIPEIATGPPSVSKDGKTQTIRLRKTFRFHTGARVTAANFVAAFNRDADPGTKSPLVGAGYLSDIAGAQDVFDGKAKTVSGVRAVGSYTLEIRTTKPLPDLASRLAMPFFCPIAAKTPFTEINNPLGSGPYYIASHVPNRQIVLERNAFYRGSRPANVDRVIWTIGLAPEACRQSTERNAVDYCSFIPPTDVKALVAKYGINRPNGRFFFTPVLGTFFFAFNHDRQAFKGEGQIPLMKAINYVVDRHALAAAAGYLSGRRTDQILPTAMGRDADIYPLGVPSEQDIAKARSLKAKAKYRPTKLILYTHVPGFLGVNAIWADIFKYGVSRLGIDVEIKYIGTTITQLLQRIGTRGEPFDVAIGSWNPDYSDGFAYFGPLLDGNNITPSGNLNFAYFDRPKYNRAIERISRMTGPARTRAWADLDTEMMRDDPPWMPFMAGTERDFVSKSFGCYVYQPAVAAPDLAAACKK